MLKSLLGKPLAKITETAVRKWSSRPIETQQTVFDSLLETGKNTAFGKEHHFDKIKTYEDFKRQIPVRSYEDFIPYIERIKAGEENVLWKGMPVYFCKTSGTTAGIKYIPISKESISNHINCAKNALLMYIARTGNSGFLNGKLIFFSGSPQLEKMGKVLVGRLSGIVNHHVPSYLRKSQMPSLKTNCIEDWEEKVDAIVEETMYEDMRLISGIPPWVQMYFDKIETKSGKKAGELFPNFSLFVHGGVNYEPYRKKFENSIGRKVDTLETYPSSEGFIAFQDSKEEDGLLLVLNEGIFFEFIPAKDFFAENPLRISLKDVELGVNYAIILNTNAGLWGYSIGDTVKFVSKNPYRIVVTGRIKHYISAFGEHIIGEEIENAIQFASAEENAEVVEFTVAPQVNPKEGLPYHEWFVEFSSPPESIDSFAQTLDKKMQEQNIYYRDLVNGNVLQSLKLNVMKKDSFIAYMKSQGKLGGQNKVPHLSNDRKIADLLRNFIEDVF